VLDNTNVSKGLGRSGFKVFLHGYYSYMEDCSLYLSDVVNKMGIAQVFFCETGINRLRISATPLLTTNLFKYKKQIDIFAYSNRYKSRD
jgi:hypothetical protein